MERNKDANCGNCPYARVSDDRMICAANPPGLVALHPKYGTTCNGPWVSTFPATDNDEICGRHPDFFAAPEPPKVTEKDPFDLARKRGMPSIPPEK